MQDIFQLSRGYKNCRNDHITVSCGGGGEVTSW